jgi:hypothetical protein
MTKTPLRGVLYPLLLAVSFFAARADDARLSEHSVDLTLASGEAQRALYVAPSVPRATIVMLPGGTGDIGITNDGDLRHDRNFVVRTRDLWAARGYAVLIPDWIDRESLRGARSSPEYAAAISDLIRFAHSRSPAPVFLLGTSQGSIAAANGAAHAAPGTLAGVILTETVSVLGGSHETVFDAHLSDVRVSALIVANRDDRCDVAPPSDAPKIAAALTHAPDVRVAEVSGGVDHSKKPCGSLTPHGYYGIEDKVVGLVSNWIDDHINHAR